MAIEISGKQISIDNIDGEEFKKKYSFKCQQVLEEETLTINYF